MIMSMWQSRDPPVRIMIRGEPMFCERFEANLDVGSGVITYKGENGHGIVSGEVKLR